MPFRDNYKHTTMKYLIFFSALFLFGACTSSTETVTKAADNADSTGLVKFTPEQAKNAGITTGSPELRSLSATVRVNGTVDVPPQNRVSISFPTGGYLKSTSLIPGTKVSKGQVIAVMEDQSFISLQEDYLVAISRLEMLTLDYQRQKELNAAKTSSDKVFQQTQADFTAQQVTVAALKQKLLLIGIQPDKLSADKISRTVNIHSPIDGYVTAVNVNIGKYISSSDVMFELVNPADLHVALTVFEKDLPFIRPGQKVQVSLVADPSRTFTAEVSLVGQQLDANRATEVHCHLDGSPEGIVPGMFVSAEIEVTKTKALAVPVDAVVRLKEHEYVFVQVADLEFSMVPVTTGITQDGWQEILSAEVVLEGQTLITRNAWSALMLRENRAE